MRAPLLGKLARRPFLWAFGKIKQSLYPFLHGQIASGPDIRAAFGEQQIYLG